MIVLHRLGHAGESFHLNPDLIVMAESNPDTVVTLTTGTRMLVIETPEEVAAAVREWRGSVLAGVVRTLPRRSTGLALVRGAAGDPPRIGGDQS
jgi:flagellar protein FlbD